jgi:acetate kinase
MKILVLNYGSSTVKFQFFDITEQKKEFLAKGLVEHPGIEEWMLTYYTKDKEKIIETFDDEDVSTVVGDIIIKFLNDKKYGSISSSSEIEAVDHRIVHGGEFFSQSVIVTNEVKQKIRECISFAPLHNPYHLRGIEETEEVLSNIPQVVVFDTAFHSTMPNYAFIYALPFNYYEEYGIRRYGFHGTSHKYVSNRTAELIGQPIEKLKIITCHLGNGASVCAVKYGKSVDTSMGFTPLEGLVMGTRCGSIDPAIVLQIIARENLSLHEMHSILNKHSGLLGVSGISNDMRDIIKEMQKGSERAKLAFEIFTYTLRKYIGAYAAAMDGVDAISFTAGIGENAPLVREEVCKGLSFLGVKIDSEKNNSAIGVEKEISSSDSKIKVFCVPTNEELVIAEETFNLVSKLKKR